MLRASSKNNIEVGRSEPCPCGATGKTYAACCKKRKIKWTRDHAGNLGRQVKLSSEAASALQSAAEDVKAIFGRKARKTDPVFAESYSISKADYRREMLRRMEVAKIEPQLVYAFLQTDRVVTDKGLLTSTDLAEYEAAINSFEEQVASGTSIEDLINPKTPEMMLSESLRQVQIIGGYYIDKYVNSGAAKRSARNTLDAEFVISFAIVNFIRCLRSIYVLLENDISYDAYYLVRSLYENYLIVKYMYVKPEKAAPVIEQIHATLTLNAGVAESGKTIKSNRSKLFNFGNMAEQLNEREFYDEFYGSLSTVAHSATSQAHFFIDKKGFNYLDVDFEMSALLMAHDISLRTFIV